MVKGVLVGLLFAQLVHCLRDGWVELAGVVWRRIGKAGAHVVLMLEEFDKVEPHCAC